MAKNVQAAVADGTVHILCLRPGLRRGGIAHPAHAVHARVDLTREQLVAILADPLLVVVVGVRLALDDLPAEAD